MLTLAFKIIFVSHAKFPWAVFAINNNYKYATHTFLCFKYQMIAFLKVFKFKISIHSWRLLFEMTDSPDTPIANVNVREKIQIFNNFLKILKIIVETWFFYWIVKKIMHFFMQKTELIYLKTANFTVVFRNFLKTANFSKKFNIRIFRVLFFFEYLANRSRYFYILKSSEFVMV